MTLTLARMDSSSDSSLPEDHEVPIEKKKTVVTDFAIEYMPDSSQAETAEQAETGDQNQMETLCYKVHRVVDESGTTISRQTAERSSWLPNEIEYLIVLRSTAARVFDQAVETKYTISSLWENIAKQLPKDAELGTGKSAQECQWMWNMLMREYTSVLRGTKQEADFPYFQDMDQAWKYFRPADRRQKSLKFNL